MPDKTPGQVAFETYHKVAGSSVHNLPCPTWPPVDAITGKPYVELAQAWEAAAQAWEAAAQAWEAAAQAVLDLARAEVTDDEGKYDSFKPYYGLFK